MWPSGVGDSFFLFSYLFSNIRGTWQTILFMQTNVNIFNRKFIISNIFKSHSLHCKAYRYIKSSGWKLTKKFPLKQIFCNMLQEKVNGKQYLDAEKCKNFCKKIWKLCVGYHHPAEALRMNCKNCKLCEVCYLLQN